LSKVVKVRYEGGVLKPLRKLELEEGEEVEIVIRRRHSHVFGALLRRRPELRPEEVDKVIEEIGDEGVL